MSASADEVAQRGCASLGQEKKSSWRDETQLNDERLLTTGAPPQKLSVSVRISEQKPRWEALLRDLHVARRSPLSLGLRLFGDPIPQ